MSQSVTLSTRVPIDFRNQVDELARALKRDRAWIVEQAVKRYIAEEAEFLEAVERGRTDVRAGRFTEWGDFDKELDAIIDSSRA